jgi:hypothetical protein
VLVVDPGGVPMREIRRSVIVLLVAALGMVIPSVAANASIIKPEQMVVTANIL